MVAASVATVTTTAAAATATHHTGDFGKFFVCSQAAFHYFSSEVQVTTCERMVHIHYDDIFLHFYHTSVDALTFRSHQGDNGTFYYTIAVEFPFYHKDFFGEVNNMVVVIFTISF